MTKANKFFTERGKVSKEIKYRNEKIKVTIHIPTNREHDNIMEEFTIVTELGTTMKAAEMIEERLIRNIVDLPFDVPRTEDVNGDYTKWLDATDNEKRCAIRVMDPKLREIINNEIVGETELSEDEAGN